MIKRVIAIFLLAALSLQISSKVVVYLDYYANTDMYTKDCENKAIPLMHCNGKCQMVKKIKEQEKKDTQSTERKSINDEVMSSKSFFASVNNSFISLRSAYTYCSEFRPKHMPRSFFHPPGA